MKITKFLAVAIAATTVFASCSKSENTEPTSNEYGTVLLNLALANTETRVVGAPVGKHYLEFNDGGMIYFTSGTGEITKYFTVVKKGTTPVTANDEVSLDAAATSTPSPITLTGVPESSKRVYIVGNVTGLPTSGNISQVTGKIIEMKNLVSTSVDEGVKKVPLYGTSALNTAANPYTATVNMAPIASRIEIHKFTAATNITQYQVDGIFINNVYEKSKLPGVMTATATPANDLFDAGAETNGQAPTVYKDNSTQYPSANKQITYEYNAAGIGTRTAQEYAPAGTNVWAFNVLAPTDGAAFPQIIVQLSGFDTSEGYENIQWMTITKFIDTSDNSEITSFDAGKIYQITNLNFDDSNLDVKPHQEDVTADVTVVLVEWEPVDVKPW